MRRKRRKKERMKEKVKRERIRKTLINKVETQEIGQIDIYIVINEKNKNEGRDK